MRFRVFAALVGGATLIGVVLNACTPQRTALEQVLSAGELRVYTRNSATTYYQGPHGPAGLEYELAKAFAKRLGVRLKLVVEDNLETMFNGLRNGKADLAAAGLAVTREHAKQVHFGPAYQQITQQLVYRKGTTPKPRNITDTSDGDLEVVANSSHSEQLRKLKQKDTDLKWYENQDAGSTELLTLVAQEIIDYTIVNSNELAMNRRYYPKLQVAFDVSKPQELAWALPRSEDTSLYDEVSRFFNDIKKSGELKRMVKHYYEHVRNYDYAGTPYFLRHVRSRLPLYRQAFEKAAKKTDLDWRLLAAVAYQESHWNPLAVSPTGVKGIMMLTNRTANQLGVFDRTDPRESIKGGALYIRTMFERFDDIAEPDRMWFALAAYNVGYGHVRDTQWITMKRGGNPNKWTDVKANLPLLRQHKWFHKTRYGYARGNEPVKYVENIRSYYDILRWHMGDTPRNTPHSILVYASPVL